LDENKNHTRGNSIPDAKGKTGKREQQLPAGVLRVSNPGELRDGKPAILLQLLRNKNKLQGRIQIGKKGIEHGGLSDAGT
jgi:hypothetical protein